MYRYEFDTNNIISYLRELAKSSYWQTCFNMKEAGVKLFKNDREFTDLQMLFLNFLTFYNAIFTDISLNDVPEIVLKHNIYEDAYIYYKNRSTKKQMTENKQNMQTRDKNTEQKINQTSWVFKRPKRK